MTVGQALKHAADELAASRIPDPGVEAEWMLAHLLSVPRNILFLKSGLPLAPPFESALAIFLERRTRREPLQHILGSVSFCGIEVTVNEHALVPRPETEELADHAWSFLNAGDVEQPKVLDFGTGTGCLAIAVATNCGRAQVHAIDKSRRALKLARDNVRELNLTERITFGLGDGFEALDESQRFDLMISNPPYIPARDIGGLQPEVRDYDPRLALDGGQDGLEFYRMFAERAGERLNSGGTLMAEFGDGQEGDLETIFSATGWERFKAVKDLSGRPRFFEVHWSL
ncbi:MAG: peptide chain release factor N(5)-glutamine methyltransferase [Limisphaerales bacterium]